MKDAIFAMAVFGTLISWLVWGVLTGDKLGITKARHFLAAAILGSIFSVTWAILYGA